MLSKLNQLRHQYAIKISHFYLVILYACTTTLLLNQLALNFIFNLKLQPTVHNELFKFTLVFLIFTLQVISCIPFLVLGVTKYIVVAFTFIAFITSYFSSGYGIIFDGTVTESVFVTNYSEISQYFNLNLFLNLSLIIMSSLALITLVRVPPLNIKRRSLLASKMLGLSILSISLTASFFYKDYASFLRNNRQIRHMVTPLSPVYQITKHSVRAAFPKKYHFENIGNYALKKNSLNGRNKLIILVLGETARSDHFSLNGYTENLTNDQLGHRNVISLKNMTSCGTATATSVPCMFSDLGRSGFDADKANERGNLLDVATSAGYKVTWIDNNTGCQGVCARLTQFDLTKVMNNDLCKGKTCYDEILLKALDQVISSDGPHLVVLHMLGSHGPSYHLRYPPEFKKFQPSCDTSDLSQCSREQVNNSYDNTILYTDFVLAKIIDRLKQVPNKSDTALLYVSDHGESLGENGIYLHSLPYFLAPKEQKHVPAILWFSDQFLNPVNSKFIHDKKLQACEFSHDNIFSSLLTLMDIEAKEYRPENDIFQVDAKNCKMATILTTQSEIH